MKTIKKAVFEIIIVFFGVSFAFILNNWREASSKNTKEQFYISGYLKDLKANSEELSLIIEQDSIWFEKIRPHVHLLSSNSYNADSAMSLVLLIGSIKKCPIIENTNNLIINSGEFNLISDNIIQNNIIETSWKYGVNRLLFLGSSCIYPKFCNQPIKEEYLLTGALEPTNEFYALAKIVGIKTCEAYNKQLNCDFITVMPTNLYGANDNFNPETSHVPAALVDKFHYAKAHNLKNVVIWGDGNPFREFMHVDDCAKACLFLMERYDEEGVINIGTGVDVTIKELAANIQKIVGYDGNISFDTSKPNGTPRKLLNVSKIENLGWKHTISLEEGLKMVYSNIDSELSTFQ